MKKDMDICVFQSTEIATNLQKINNMLTLVAGSTVRRTSVRYMNLYYCQLNQCFNIHHSLYDISHIENTENIGCSLISVKLANPQLSLLTGE